MTVCMVLSMISALKIFDQIAVMTDDARALRRRHKRISFIKLGLVN